jgi:uncharacterized membrane protein YadS
MDCRRDDISLDCIGAIGLEIDILKLMAKGFWPALLGALAFLFIAGFSLTLIKLME